MTSVIAEIGVNWNGEFSVAKKMMEEAKSAGCDAVKFQAFNEEIIGKHPESSRLLKTTISRDNVDDMDKLAKSVGIEWFCTPMYPEAVDLLDPYVKRFKIREIDGRSLLENKTSKLLDKVFETRKEVIVSSQISPHDTKYFKNSNIRWLYCVPKYPCDLTDLDFSKINNFDGYSNHCTHFMAPLTAAILGAEIIEIHTTSDKKGNFFDNNVSFDYSELKNLIELIHISKKIKMEKN